MGQLSSLTSVWMVVVVTSWVIIAANIDTVEASKWCVCVCV